MRPSTYTAGFIIFAVAILVGGVAGSIHNTTWSHVVQGLMFLLILIGIIVAVKGAGQRRVAKS